MFPIATWFACKREKTIGIFHNVAYSYTKSINKAEFVFMCVCCPYNDFTLVFVLSLSLYCCQTKSYLQKASDMLPKVAWSLCWLLSSDTSGRGQWSPTLLRDIHLPADSQSWLCSSQARGHAPWFSNDAFEVQVTSTFWVKHFERSNWWSPSVSLEIHLYVRFGLV